MRLKINNLGFLYKALLICIFAVLAVCFSLQLSDNAKAAQTIPYKVNFQGRLTNSAGNIVANGSYNIKFRLFNVSTGGTNVWEEFRETTSRVVVTNGLFTVQLGDVTALSPTLFTNPDVYLEVELPTPATATCSTAGCASFTEGAMTPRSKLAAAAYAFNADTVDGIDGASLARNDAANTFTGNTQVFRNGTDSANAFDIQNAATASLFSVGTANGGNISLLGNNSGASGAWTTNGSSGLAAREGAGSATVNGYSYVIGGLNAAGTGQTTVQFAKTNANGSIGTWTTTTALPAARVYAAVASYGNYIYVMGGSSTGASSAGSNTVYYARVNPDGTITSWTAGSTLNFSRNGASGAAYKGYLYSVGGDSTAGTSQANVFYSKINADGSPGTFATTASLAAARTDHRTFAANGYVYAVAGHNSGTGSANIQYAVANADGTLGTWTDQGVTNPLPANRDGGAIGVINGYAYYIGGYSAGTTTTNTVYYAQLGAAGAIGAWTSQGSNLLTTSVADAAYAVANGYLYVLTGFDGTDAAATAYYTSPARVTVGGSLDLVGLSGENLADTGSGGSLTAGNTKVIGSLEVQGVASFAQNVYLNQNISVGGAASFQNQTNSATAFQIQNAAGSSLFTVNTASSNIVLGTNINPASIPTSVATTDVITSHDIAQQASGFQSIAIGSDGLPIIAFDIGAANFDIRVLKCTNASCSTSTATTVHTADDTSNPAIAIGSDGYPVIAFADVTNGDLMVTKCNNLDCSSSSTAIADDDGTSLGGRASIAISTDGFPIISHYVSGPNDLRTTKCDDLACTDAGNTDTDHDAANSVGAQSSIAIAPDGFAIISYQNVSNFDRKVAKCNNTNCTSSTINTVVSAVDTFNNHAVQALAIGADGLAIMSMKDDTNDDLIVTKCNNNDCSSATTTTLDSSVADLASASSITIGNDGLPIISYRDTTNSALRVIKCTNASCTAFGAPTTVDNAANVGSNPTIVISNDGLPIVTHWDSGNADVKTARCGNTSCTGAGTTITGGLTLGSSSTNFGSIYANNIQTASSFDTLRLGTGGIDRISITGAGAATLNVSSLVAKPATDSSTFFQLQNAAGSTLFLVDTSSSGIRIGTSTDNVTFTNGTFQPILNGAARYTRYINIVPEYTGAVLTADGTNNTGTMTSDFCSGTSRLSLNTGVCAATDEHNYYSWTSATGDNDYDVYVRYRVPSDFSAFASNTAISMYGWRTDATNNLVELALFNAAGTQCGTTTNVATGTATWTTTALTGNETSDAACTAIAAGDIVLFRVRLTASAAEFARAGAINVDYLSRY